MVIAHIHAKNNVQMSVGSKAETETNGRTDTADCSTERGW